MDFVRPGRGHDANRDCPSSPMAMPIRRRRPLGAASRNRSGIEIVMSPLPMLRLNTRIGGSDSTPTTAFAGPRRCRFRTLWATPGPLCGVAGVVHVARDRSTPIRVAPTRVPLRCKLDNAGAGASPLLRRRAPLSRDSWSSSRGPQSCRREAQRELRLSAPRGSCDSTRRPGGRDRGLSVGRRRCVRGPSRQSLGPC